MQIISDLHIHGRFSRATSKDLTISNLEKWGRLKGVDLVGTGDFAQPDWYAEIRNNLSDDGTGILKTASGFPFLLQTEISLIYSQGGKGRRVHLVVLAPGFEVAEQVTDYLKSIGRVDYDGRPIFNKSCIEFTEKMMAISPDIELIPAHIWTPWFSLFGSNSGFNTIKECFGDQLKHIHALETGLSSDPAMNWRLSQLDDFRIVSFSDLHSFWPWRLGREATVFDFEKLTYDNVIRALRTGEGLKMTIEVDPGYGKYHFDGHRNCGVCLSPEQSRQLNKICPKCGRPMTIGVLNRVEELADRKLGFRPKNAKPYLSLMPLSELISAVTGKAVASKDTWKTYYEVMKAGSSECDILINVPEEKLAEAAKPELVKAIIDNRAGRIEVRPGYDGEYGVPLIGDARGQKSEQFEIKHRQMRLGDF